MFDPLSTILVAILAFFVFGEKLYLGRYVMIHLSSFSFFPWKKQTLLQSLYDGANDISFRVINFNVIVACGFFAVIVAFQFTVNYIHLLNNFDLKHTFSSLLISVYASLSPILTIVCLLKIHNNLIQFTKAHC